MSTAMQASLRAFSLRIEVKNTAMAGALAKCAFDLRAALKVRGSCCKFFRFSYCLTQYSTFILTHFFMMFMSCLAFFALLIHSTPHLLRPMHSIDCVCDAGALDDERIPWENRACRVWTERRPC